MLVAITVLFIIGYLAIALEHPCASTRQHRLFSGHDDYGFFMPSVPKPSFPPSAVKN